MVRAMRSPASRARWLSGVLLVAFAPLAAGQPSAASPAAAAQPARFIVQLRPLAASGHEAARARFAALATRQRLILEQQQEIVSDMTLLLVRAAAGDTAEQMLARLRSDPEVDYAEADQRRYPQATPDDSLFSEQWYEQQGQPAAVDAVDAWDVTTGSPGLVIADLDTGVRFDHPDLRNASANRLLPGYNLISSAVVANNGYGRGPDASDPGDWIAPADLQNPVFASCTLANSSWHGTRVAGILGAISDNQTGIAGMTWEGWIEPVRVLGKCGGYDSDIIAGMAWAAGNHVEGVPDNPYPARILNMSLGAGGSCPASYQQIIDELVAEGVLIVVSAGNAGGPVDAPANCVGVAGVAGIRQSGSKVGYSSLGPTIAVSAPAGNCDSDPGLPCFYSIITTTNTGTTIPASNTYTSQESYNIGTSFSAPQVAAIAGLMLTVNGNLTSQQLIARIQSASQPFPASAAVPACHVPVSASDLQTSECGCTTQTCGAGMANANGAVLQALRPIAAVAVPTNFAPGAQLQLDASGSAAACGANIVTYQWTVVQPASGPPAIVNAATPRAGIAAPAAPASYTLMLTVTDDQGRSDSAPVIVNATSAVSSAPAAAGTTACLTPVSYTVSSSASGGASSGGTGSNGGSGGSGSSGSSSSSSSSSSASGGGGGGGGSLDLLTVLGLSIGALICTRPRRYSSR